MTENTNLPYNTNLEVHNYCILGKRSDVRTKSSNFVRNDTNINFNQ